MKDILNTLMNRTLHKHMNKLEPLLLRYPAFHTRDSFEEKRFVLRFARREDLPDIVELERKGYDGYLAWDLVDFIRDWNRNRYGVYILLEKKDGENKRKLIGMVIGRFVMNRSHISHLVVDPDLQSQGLGSYLLEVWLKSTVYLNKNEVTLEVRESNVTAQRLYFKYGFKIQQVKNHYYDSGESALYLKKVLKSGEDF